MRIFKQGEENTEKGPKKPTLVKKKNRFYYHLIFVLIFSIIFDAYCIYICRSNSVLSIFKAINFTEVSSSDSCLDRGETIVNCRAKNLYYSGYNYVKGKKTKGYYYYSLDNNHCQLYLISKKEFKESSNPPKTIAETNFTACISTDDSNRYKLVSNLASDLNWDYNGLSDFTDNSIVSQLDYNIKFYSFIIIATILGFILTITSLFMIIKYNFQRYEG